MVRAARPVAGNNIEVTKSHSVAICWMTVKNTSMVRGNDGRISRFHNRAGRNIDASRNAAYRPLPADTTKHKRPGAIRVRKDTADGQIRLFANDLSRALLGLGVQ